MIPHFSHKLRFIGVAFLLLTALGLSAATYELTVDNGTVALDAAMEAAYPTATLKAEDVIVKYGSGTLTDSETALAVTDKLRFEICAGVFEEGISRVGCTYCVSNGAAVKVSVALNTLTPKGSSAAFMLCGAGTKNCPGALYLTAASGASNQYIVYELTGDAVICAGGQNVQFSSSASSTKDYNLFKMNGHALRFKNTTTTKWFRFRYAVNFTDPGEIIFDKCGVTKYSEMPVRVSGTASTLPCVRLVNSAKINFVDSNFANKIDILDCEAGTKITKVNDDPTDYTLACVRGFPEITEEVTDGVCQKITIKRLIAKAEDINAGRFLEATPNLHFAGNATVDIDDPSALTKLPDGGVLLAQGTDAVIGTASRGPTLAENHLRLRQDGQSLWLCPPMGLILLFR